MKNTIKISIILCFLIFILPTAFAALNVALSDQGTDVITISTGENLASGSLNIQVWDAASGGTLVYNESFANAIDNGSWNIMIGENASSPLALEYGNTYYKDYQIVGEDADFTNFTGATVERQFFYSPLGSIGAEDITNGNFSFNGTTLYINGDNSRVGIGTNNPTATLEVSGSIIASGGITSQDTSEGIITNVISMPLGTSNITVKNSTSDEIFIITTGGLVGIGITNPSNALEVNGDAIFQGAMITYDTYTGIRTTKISAQGAGENITFQNDTLDPIMILTNDGKVGIGTTTPLQALEVVGGIMASGAVQVFDGTVGVTTAIITATQNQNITFQNSSLDAIMTLVNDGKVGIGTTGPANALSVAGAIDAASTVYAYDFGGIGAHGYYISFVNDSGGQTANISQTGDLVVVGETSIGGVTGAANIVCVKGDGNLGTCTNDNGDGTCICA
jgi:hypothetical protein